MYRGDATGGPPSHSFGSIAVKHIPPVARSLTVSRLYSIDRNEPASFRSSHEYYGGDGGSPSSSGMSGSGGSGETSASASPLSSRGWSPRNLQGSPLRKGRASPRAVDIVRSAREELEASMSQTKTASPLGRHGTTIAPQMELPPLPKSAMSTLAAMRTETSMLRRRVLSAPTSQDCALINSAAAVGGGGGNGVGAKERMRGEERYRRRQGDMDGGEFDHPLKVSSKRDEDPQAATGDRHGGVRAGDASSSAQASLHEDTGGRRRSVGDAPLRHSRRRSVSAGGQYTVRGSGLRNMKVPTPPPDPPPPSAHRMCPASHRYDGAAADEEFDRDARLPGAGDTASPVHHRDREADTQSALLVTSADASKGCDGPQGALECDGVTGGECAESPGSSIETGAKLSNVIEAIKSDREAAAESLTDATREEADPVVAMAVAASERIEARQKSIKGESSPTPPGNGNDHSAILKCNEPMGVVGDIDWSRGELIGEGAYGKVFTGLNLRTGEMMAVKCLSLGSRRREEQKHRLEELEREISMYRRLRHEHIVSYLGAAKSEGEDVMYVFLEYISGGCIASMLKRFGRFREDLVRLYVRQILLGLEYLHREKIIHRDLKGANILITKDGTAKLADFGASKAFPDNSVTDANKSLHGSIFWMAPEVVTGKGYGRRADVWSLGCTVVEMLSGCHPWPDADNQWTAIFAIARTTTGPPVPDDASDLAREFLAHCFKIDPAERLTVSELLQHPFVAGTDRAIENARTSTALHHSM